MEDVNLSIRENLNEKHIPHSIPSPFRGDSVYSVPGETRTSFSHTKCYSLSRPLSEQDPGTLEKGTIVVFLFLFI